MGGGRRRTLRSQNELADDRTKLTVLTRTKLAHDRTLIAWVADRDLVDLVGFTIYKFFRRYATARRPCGRTRFGPRGFALVLMTASVAGLHRAHSIPSRCVGCSKLSAYSPIPNDLCQRQYMWQ